MARMKNDGRGRLGGRAKGTPNKLPADLKEWIKELLLGNRKYFKESIAALPPDQYVQVYLRLINYIVPKMKPVEEEQPSTVDIWCAQLDEEIRQARAECEAKMAAHATANSDTAAANPQS